MGTDTRKTKFLKGLFFSLLPVRLASVLGCDFLDEYYFFDFGDPFLKSVRGFQKIDDFSFKKWTRSLDSECVRKTIFR